MHITVTNLLSNARLNQHRLLLFLPHCEHELLSQICSDVKSQYNTSQNKKQDINAINYSALSTKHLPIADNNADSADQINALLGTENNLIIYDVSEGLHASLFAAASGTLVAGGVMVVLHEAYARTSKTQANPIQKLLIGKRCEAAPHSLFLKRINERILHDCVAINGYSNTLVLKQTHNAQTGAANNLLTQIDDLIEPWLVEQNIHLAQLKQLLEQDSKATIVVQADRGRGKSALLGKAIAQSKTHVTLTASRKESTAVLQRFANEYATTTNANAAPEFMPVDAALLQQHELLLVEEAGALPLAVLLQLQSLSKQIIFATTVQGYEGAGRGFAIRFAKLLNKFAPNWVQIRPTLPIRWAANDPLENFINSLLLLNAQLPAVAAHSIDAQTSVVQLVEKTNLANNEEQLEQIYGLLVQAHYQTTPADLRNLLDQEELLVFALYSGQQLTGAAIVALEGNIDPQLAQAVLSKKRRLANQLLPQLLAQSANNVDALGSRYARIVRIAIHPGLHRQGLGTALVDGIKTQLKPQVAAIGTSFGADSTTLSFWQKQGLHAFHYGLRQNPRSGLRATAMLSTEDPLVHSVLCQARGIFKDNIGFRGAENSTSVLRLLTNNGIENTTQSTSMTFDLVARYSSGERSFIDTIAALHEVAAELDDDLLNSRLHALTALCQGEELISSKLLRRLEHETRTRLKVCKKPNKAASNTLMQKALKR